MACPHCNAEVGASDLFCFACGAKLEALPAAAATSPTAASAAESAPSLAGAPRRGVRLLLIILVNLCLVVASAWMAYALLQQRYRRPPAATVLLGTPRRVVHDAGRPASLAAAAQDASATAAAGAATATGRGARPRSPGKPRVSKRTSGSTRGRAPVGTPSGATSARPGSSDQPSPTSQGASTSQPSTSTPRPGAPGAPTPASATEGDAAETAGILNSDSVRIVVRHYLPQVRACYDRALRQQDSISGVVELKFEVSDEGRVSSSTVHSNSTGHEGLGTCIAAVLRSWKFPRPVGGSAVFIYPFVFSPGD